MTDSTTTQSPGPALDDTGPDNAALDDAALARTVTFREGAARHRALTIWGAVGGAGGRLVPRFGPRLPLVAGLAAGALGIGWFAGLSPHGTFLAEVLGPSLLASVGLGICFVAVATAATSGVAPHEAGLASGLLNSSRQCGGSIGLTVLVTIANATGNHTAAPTAPSPSPGC